MAWKRLDYSDIIEILAQDEIDKLDQMSISADVDDICNKILDSVSDSFRGAFRSKGYTVDVRDHYIPPSYKIPVLNIARVQIWSRFPDSKNIAIDDVREKLYDDAMELLKDPYVGVETPNYDDDPELSGRTDLNKSTDASLTIPLQRFSPIWQWNGFPTIYRDPYLLHK